MAGRVGTTVVVAAFAAGAVIGTFVERTSVSDRLLEKLYAQGRQTRGFPEAGTDGPLRGNAEREGTPIRQNSIVNRPFQREGLSSRVVKELQGLMKVYRDPNVGDSNTGRNPYRRVEPWGELPPDTERWSAPDRSGRRA